MPQLPCSRSWATKQRTKISKATLTSVRRHLNTGALFIFDLWFGPAVLTQKPADRVKIIEQGDKKIIRYAHPVLDIVNHTVEVNYTVLEISRNKVLMETKESHLMRFFFYQELKYFLEKNGFEVLDNVVLKTGDTFGTTVNRANIISFVLVLFLI